MDWKENAIDMTSKDIVSLDFDSLVNHIQNTSDILQQDARLVINRNVTTRQVGKSQAVSDFLPDSEKSQSLIILFETDCPLFISRDGFSMQTKSGKIVTC